LTTEFAELFSRVRRGDITRREFVHRMLELGLGSATASLALTACRSGERSRAPAAEDLPPLGSIEGELYIYNWADYIPEEVVPNFEGEFGVKVTYDTYETNEEMLNNLRAGVRGYDLVVPTGWQVQAMRGLGLLRPLSRRHLPNWDNLSRRFANQPNPTDSAYAVPYVWGITGIAYRRDKLRGPVESWGAFLNRRYRGRATMLNERREVVGAMLRYRGHSLNSTDPGELAQAKIDAIAAKQHLRAYLSVEVKPYLLSGEVWLAQLYNGYARRLAAVDPAIAFAIPREGCTIYTDFMCVTRSAANPRAAHEFINYLLRPEVGARLAEFTGYGTPNDAAAKLLPDPVPYPSSRELRRLEYQVDLGTANEAWDQVWEEIRQA
jgi:spermidine/putrescine transport system substrate-binding protein